MKFKRFLPILLVVSMSLAACTSSAEAVPEEEEIVQVAVGTTTAKSRSLKTEVIYAGKLAPQETISVMPKIQGKAKETYFDVGDTVNEGDVLFTLDEQDIQNQIRTLTAQYNQASQGVASAQNALSSVTGGQYESGVLQQDATIEGNKIKLDNATLVYNNVQVGVDNSKVVLENISTTYENTKVLYEAGTVSKSDFDQVQQGYDQAVLALEQSTNAVTQAQIAIDEAKFSLGTAEQSKNILTGSITEEQKKTARIGISTAQSGASLVKVQLDIVRETLNDTTVKSPITGIVSKKNVKGTEFVSTQLPSYVIINTENLDVEVKVSELIINKINIGETVDLYINSLSAEPFKATIKTISPSADETSTYPITLQISNEDGILKAGMFAELRFVNEISENTIVAPVEAVLSTGDKKYVYINNNGVATYKEVTLGLNNGKDVEILSGVKVNDELITTGQNYVTDGVLINVVEKDIKGE